MVLSLKTWKSRSLPGLPRTEFSSSRFHDLRACNAGRRDAQSEFKKAAVGKAMAAFLFSWRVQLSRMPVLYGMLAIRSRSRLFTGNESDQVGKQDLIRCDRVNVRYRMADI